MLKNYALFFLAGAMFFVSCKEEEKQPPVSNRNLTEYANLFIGTGGHGHTYPGATVPFGMLQVTPVNGTNGWDWCSGYHYSDDTLAGFGHLSLSGTGIGDLTDLLMMPSNKSLDLSVKINSRDDLPYKSRYSHTREKATPGYYSLYLEDANIEAEMTASDRVAYHRYTYAEGDTQSVVLDLGFAINWDRPMETSIKVENDHMLSGFRFSTGWAKNQKVFFAISFSKPISEYQLYEDGKAIESAIASGGKTAVQVFFENSEDQELKANVSISSVSVANAIENMGNSKDKFEFDAMRQNAETIWNNHLEAIEVETPTDSLKTIFYSALYHAQLAPVIFSDVNGEYRKQNDSISKATGTTYTTFSTWDTFRAQQPLLTIIRPDRVPDMVNSLLGYYEDTKILPVWTLYGNETNTMTGYHSIPIMTEAYLKGMEGLDGEHLYEAMKTTMTRKERGLDLYQQYGYIPYDKKDESVTSTLEYAYNDWCVAQMAKALGKDEDYKYFLDRSMAYKELMDTVTGFMRGKSVNGKWNEPFDPKFSAHREDADYTEGNAWQHSWFVLQDPEGLIALHGGNDKFVKKLEQLFTETSEINGSDVSPDISGLIGQYAHGNEPSHHIAYLFNKAGHPWKTQYWTRNIMNTQYNNTPEGLSGNEDCGQMSAWYVFSAIGLYPLNPSSGTYEIGSPLFEKSTIRVRDGKTFVIRAENVSPENMYIQSATLNGVSFNRTYVSHAEIMQGGELVLQMAATPNKTWGTDN